jgi:hypothetical protein
LGKKDNFLLRQELRLESSFDTPRCDGKTATASKGSLPRYCRLHAPRLPDEVAIPPIRDRGIATNRQPSKKHAFAVSIN